MQTASQGGVFAMTEPCEQCRGRGLIVEDPCPVCHGLRSRHLQPHHAGAHPRRAVRDGQRIRLSGKGAAGERGGPAGDLYVTVHVQPHPLFGRSGDNLTLTAPVTFDEAALGAEVKVPTLDGRAGDGADPTGHSQRPHVRVRGRGVRRRTGMRGDLLVSVEVVVPKELRRAREGGAGRLPAGGRRKAIRGPPCGRWQAAMAEDFPLSAEQHVPGPDVPVFVISVAAQLTGLHPQTLRGYDRTGLVSPGRAGWWRARYSWRDIQRLREVARLSPWASAWRASARSLSWSPTSRRCSTGWLSSKQNCTGPGLAPGATYLHRYATPPAPWCCGGAGDVDEASERT
jgi:hypothetical protein